MLARSPLEDLARKHGRSSRNAAKRRTALAALPYALRCVVLAIDPGKACSGWSIWADGKFISSGEIEVLDPAQMERVVDAAVLLGELMELPVVLVLERPPPAHVSYRGHSVRGPESVHDARGAWKNTWRRAGCSERRIADAPLNTWRKDILGKGWGGRQSDETQAQEQRVARMLSKNETVGSDEAPAICIGPWGTRAQAVRKRLPKRFQEAA